MTAGRPAPAPGIAHGMGRGLVEADWAPIRNDEAGRILANYGLVARDSRPRQAEVTWTSPRPMSAAAVVRYGPATVFMKRHDLRVRTAATLGKEHAFARHLRAHGIQVPTVYSTTDGRTTVTSGGAIYEVHEVAPGVDLYRDAMSWTPFDSLGHARSAGAALARLHLASRSFRAAARPPAVLTNSCQVVLAPDPVEAVALLVAQRRGLARYLTQRDWRTDLRPHMATARRAAALLRRLPQQWGHGDWHPSNLTWSSSGADAEVVAVLDLGLANCTFAAHDLALALERCTVGWLDLAETGKAEADLDGAAALLDGYEATRPLSPMELSAVAEVLPVAHLEYALSEVEYFADVAGSQDNADLAYDVYLLGHTRWFDGPGGRALTEFLASRPGSAPSSSS